MSLLYNKYALANSFTRPDVTTLLDVGCRDGILKNYLRPDIIYTGLDMVTKDNVGKMLGN